MFDYTMLRGKIFGTCFERTYRGQILLDIHIDIYANVSYSKPLGNANCVFECVIESSSEFRIMDSKRYIGGQTNCYLVFSGIEKSVKK